MTARQQLLLMVLPSASALSAGTSRPCSSMIDMSVPPLGESGRPGRPADAPAPLREEGGSGPRRQFTTARQQLLLMVLPSASALSAGTSRPCSSMIDMS
ncbi:hypothetical protein ACF07T_08605, partial [Streptomyces sp. NPDC015184]|uniref:hypothetical protein n=1 Tax=Streptomyces sp. NPDC015184 TaxID=3364946 RepID=UPI0036F96193